MKEIEETQDQKYQKAIDKIKADLGSKIDKIGTEVAKEQQKFKDEIGVKY